MNNRFVHSCTRQSYRALVPNGGSKRGEWRLQTGRLEAANHTDY